MTCLLSQHFDHSHLCTYLTQVSPIRGLICKSGQLYSPEYLTEFWFQTSFGYYNLDRGWKTVAITNEFRRHLSTKILDDSNPCLPKCVRLFSGGTPARPRNLCGAIRDRVANCSPTTKVNLRPTM